MPKSQGDAVGLMVYMAFSQLPPNPLKGEYVINPMPTAWGKNPTAAPWGKNPMASPWVHNQIVRQLYAKYGLSEEEEEEEVAFIEGMIKGM